MKTLFVLASVMVVLFLVVPNKIEAQKRKAATKIIEGTISSYDCGDNCYLTIIDKNGKEHIRLCTAPICTKWGWEAMPDSYKGKRVRVTIGKGTRLDGRGDIVDRFDAFTKIQFLLAATTENKTSNPNAGNSQSLEAALIGAAGKGNVVALRTLLAKGANIEATGGRCETALIEAAAGGHLAAVQVLLAKGANVDAGGLDCTTLIRRVAPTGTALIEATENGHLAVVQALLAKGADVNKKGGGLEATALMHAAARLAKGNHEGTDGDEEQPGGSLPIVQALLAKGADMEVKDASGWTALMYAAGDGHLAIVQALLNKGANIEGASEEGWTALMNAASLGRLTVVKALLARGANVNAKTTEGETALFAAASHGQLPVVQALLAKGADVNTKNKRGQIALDVANLNGHSDIVQILREAQNKQKRAR